MGERDDVESVAAVDVQVGTPGRSRLPFVLAAAAVLGAGLGAGLVSPGPADAVEAPPAVITTAPHRPAAATGIPLVASVPPEPAPEAPPPQRPESEPAPAPPTPTRQAPEPRRTPAPTVIVRAPMSVSPVPRPAFPNQHPGNGADDRGLLGLGGLL